MNDRGMADTTAFLLRALGYPKADGFAPGDPAALRALLVWLENTKIRQYPIDGRAALQAADPAAWHAAYTKYLADLECPVPAAAEHQRAALRWLLTHAVGLEYADRAAPLTAACAAAEAAAPPPADWVEAEPPPLPDASAPAVLDAVRRLLALLQVPPEQVGGRWGAGASGARPAVLCFL